jgi:hypothetical protein
MGVIARRDFMVGAVVATAASTMLPAPAAAHRPRRPTWVRLRGADTGYSIVVNNIEVTLADLDATVLAQAMAAHPGMTEDEVRRDVRIYIAAEPQLPFRAVQEVMRHMRFEKVGIVAEDRRR